MAAGDEVDGVVANHVHAQLLLILCQGARERIHLQDTVGEGESQQSSQSSSVKPLPMTAPSLPQLSPLPSFSDPPAPPHYQGGQRHQCAGNTMAPSSASIFHT